MKSAKTPIKFICNYLNERELIDLLLRQNIYEEKYSFEPVLDDSFEYLIVFNYSLKKWIPERTVVFIQEPSWSNRIQLNYLNKWAGTVFFHDKTLLQIDSKKIKETRSYLPYYSNISINQIIDNPPQKQKKISYILSNLSGNHNYDLRIKLLNQILKSNLEIDIFGRGLQINDKRYKGELLDKFDGLRDYEYSIAIENSCEKNYVTEKFTDCIFNKTVPIYYGAPNINELFPERSFINFSFENPLELINQIISNDKYDERIDAIESAFNQLINDENIFNKVDSFLKNSKQMKLNVLNRTKSLILKKIYFKTK